MALNITPYSVILDTSVNNCEFNKHLMQGSTDGKFIVTLLKDGVEQTIDPGAKVTMVLNYGVQSTCSGTTSTSNFVLAPTDQGYNITISSGKVEIPLSERITDASGINQMVLKIEDGTIAYTYSMLYTVDKNPAYSPQSTPDNLPTYNQVKAQITQLTQTVAGNTNSINTNTGKIATQDSQISTINQEITNLRAKDTGHDSDISTAKQDIVNLKAKDTAIQSDVSTLQNQVSAHSTEITTAKQNIAANTNAIITKAEKDLSNVGSFGTAKEGDMFYKKANKFEVAPINIDDTKREIVSEYSLRVPPNSVHLGENIRMSENGGFVQYDTQTLSKYYLFLDYENNRDTGTKKPIYFERGAKETKFEINSVQNTSMELTTLNLQTPVFDRQTQAIYLNLVDSVSNLCFKVTINGKDVGYYPSKNAWDSTTPEEKAKNPGYTKTTGLQKFDLEPFWSTLVEYQTLLTFKADSTIRVLGDGTKPYYAVDMNRINRKPIALMEDVGGSGGADTPGQIRDKLSTLTGDNRLDAAAIKNLPNGSGGSSTLLGLTDTPDSYAGKAGTIVRVNNSETGIEFDLPPDFALPDLSNVKSEDLKKESVKAGMLQQDLEDVDLAKLKEKVDASGANLITVGELHGDYHQGDVKEIQLHNGFDVTIDTQTKVASISLSPDMKALPDEVARIKTNLAADDTVFSYRGTKAPNYSGGPYKQYYVNITNASGGIIALKLPNDAPVNAIFTVRNSDKINPFVLSVDTGTINGSGQTYNIQENGLALFIKNSASNWNAIYGGYMANNLRQLVDLIKAQLPPNSGLTIDQIQAQLKDRLHLFSEIQTEFNDELHTFDAIEANMVTRGFSKGFSVGYGTLDTSTPPQNLNWVTAHISPNAEVVIPATNQGNKYLAIYMPVYLGALVSDVEINQNAVTTTETKIISNELDYTVLIVSTPINTNQSNRLNIEFHNKGAIGGIGVEDQRSNVFVDMDTVSFGAGFTATQDPTNTKTVKIDYSGANGMTFKDGLTGTDFTATKIQSTDKSVRIANLNGVADFSKGIPDHNEGIHVCLGNDELLNSKYGKSKLYFNDTRVKGGMFVYPDNDTKSFVIQDVDPTDDPNISGGTTFIIALYYEPNPDEKNIITQNGQIAIELVDDNDVPINDTQGNPMGAIIDYKANDKVKPELYIGECQATAFTRVHLKIDLRFANEEIISVGANTQLCIQSITKDESSGLALLSFMAYTGYQLQFDNKYYGYNSLNMAQFLNFDVPEDNTNAQQMQFGNNTYLDFKNNSKLSIVNNHLIIKDDGVNLPVWSIVKVYNKIDSKSIGGKSYKVTATLTDKDDAYRVTLLEYTGTLPAPLPTVLRYDNQNPVFTSGWVQRDSMFITEDAVQGDHTQSQTFTMPDNAKGLAIIMYHVESQIPVNLSLKDLEGDITPWFNKVIIRDNSHITEKYLASKDGIYRSIVKTPSGDLAYRYTVNSTDTKIPVGVVSGNDDKIQNDHSWTDPGSIDPNQTQGDLKFLADGKVTMSYTARCFNEQGSVNQIQFWLAKNVGGVFTEVPNSRTATTIEAQRTQPKMVSSFKFSFDVKANETYRMFAKSNKDDGFYLQSDLDGVPLYRADIEFDEFTAAEKDVFDKTNEIKFVSNGQEVYDKILQYDVQSGRMTVIDK